MSGFAVGLLSVALILVLIYGGLYIPVALGLVSFLGVWIIRGNVDVPISLLALAAADSVSHAHDWSGRRTQKPRRPAEDFQCPTED